LSSDGHSDKNASWMRALFPASMAAKYDRNVGTLCRFISRSQGRELLEAFFNLVNAQFGIN